MQIVFDNFIGTKFNRKGPFLKSLETNISLNITYSK